MSGKSRWAVSYFENCDNVRYLCTRPNLDENAQSRITYTESSHDLIWKVETDFRPDIFQCDRGDYLIFDSLADYAFASLWGYSMVLLPNDIKIRQIAENVIRDMTDFIIKVKAADGNLVIITNEVGFCPEQQDSVLMNFQKTLCAVNQRIANLADEVYLSVSGITVRIK